jgi:WD40 repeat protein
VAVGGWGENKGGAVYEVATGRRLCRVGKPSQNVVPICFSPDGKVLAVHTMVGPIDLYDTATGAALHSLQHDGKIIPTAPSAAFTPDGKTLISAAPDGMIRSWDVATGKEVRRVLANPGGVSWMALAPGGTVLALSDLITVQVRQMQTAMLGSNRIRLWDTATMKELRQLTVPSAKKFLDHTEGPLCVLFSPDGKEL